MNSINLTDIFQGETTSTESKETKQCSDRVYDLGKGVGNLLRNLGSSFCGSLLNKGKYVAKSLSFLCSKNPSEKTQEEGFHEVVECELFATHYPYERERAELMETPGVKCIRKTSKQCSTAVSEKVDSVYNSRIASSVNSFKESHPKLTSAGSATKRFISSVAHHTKEALMTPVRYVFTRPSEADINQGGVGDCYYLAALASVANIAPGHIKSHIRSHLPLAQFGRSLIRGDTRKFYDVCLYERNQEGVLEKKWVTVDNSFRSRAYGSGESDLKTTDHDGDGKREIWAALYEKAYFKLRAGDSEEEVGRAIAGHGGTGLEAFESIMGTEPVMVRMNSFSDSSDKRLRVILSAASFLPMVAGIRGRSDAHDVIEGLPGKHMYTVLGMSSDVVSGKEYVILRNPWGHHEPDMIPDGVDDGVFKLPIEEFHELCMYLTCSDVDKLERIQDVSDAIESETPCLTHIKSSLLADRVRNLAGAPGRVVSQIREDLSQLTMASV